MEEGMVPIIQAITNLGVPGVLVVGIVMLWKKLGEMEKNCQTCRQFYETLISKEREKRDQLVNSLFHDALKADQD